MNTTLQATPAYVLDARLTRCAPPTGGFHLMLSSLVPTARRPEWQVRFQTVLAQQELLALRELIDAALTEADDAPDAVQEPGDVARPLA